VNDDNGTGKPSPDFVRRLIEDNNNLSEQVKRLVKTEYALYNTQEELDNQIVLYKGLYETGKKMTTSVRIQSVFSEMGEFIIEQLNYGGYLLFKKDGKVLSLKQCGGVCSGRRRLHRTCNLKWMKATFGTLVNTYGNAVVSEAMETTECIQAARECFALQEFVIYSFHIGRKKTPSYYLVVGNPTEKDFFNSVKSDDITMIGLNNLVSLIENALNNVIHYQQLAEERKLLELKVDERTRDLNDALNDLKKLNTKLNYLSFTDELTGLYNRRGFQIFGEKYFTMARRKNNNLLLLYCDLDKFKPINDRYGHREGDMALKATAAILIKSFRDYDIVSRFGGDEFVVLLDNTPATDFPRVKKRLDSFIAEYNFTSGKEYAIEMSCGFAAHAITEDTDLTLEKLIEEADEMLYSEKRKKKNINT
jgi:diguanylate cyclase (GGDEF)-like protein